MTTPNHQKLSSTSPDTYHDTTRLTIICPFCSAPFSAKMEAEYDYSGESEDSGRWGEEVTIEIHCESCKRLIYTKKEDV